MQKPIVVIKTLLWQQLQWGFSIALGSESESLL